MNVVQFRIIAINDRRQRDNEPLLSEYETCDRHREGWLDAILRDYGSALVIAHEIARHPPRS